MKKYVDHDTAVKRLEGADKTYLEGFQSGWFDAALGQSISPVASNSDYGNYGPGYRYGYGQWCALNA